MFPVKGTTVWVNFREKSYLGKVLQTSPELNMVCVRISNYLDHVSRDSDQTDLVAHSCPVSNQSMFSNRHSSVVITCGLEDICLIESNNDPHFENKHRDSSNSNSEIIIESNSVQIPKKSDNINMVHNNSLRNNLQVSNSLEYENELSDSIGIKKLLKTSEIEESKSFPQNHKYWQCWHCNIYLSNENDMHLHVINKHKLETLLDKDNWIVIGGIRGLDYDEVNSQEDSNIKDLNNIHISTSSRKRQFFDSTSALSLSLSNEFPNQSYSYSAINHLKGENYQTQNDVDSNFNELHRQEICWSNLNGIINGGNVEYLDGILNPPYNQINFNDFSTLKNEQISYNRKIQFFQNILLQHHINSTLSSSISNSSNADKLPHRLRSNSDQLMSHASHVPYSVLSESKEMDQEILSPTKRSRIETGIKKCRKMYGIDQRHLWCNQCKWKKACSRFLSEINLN